MPFSVSSKELAYWGLPALDENRDFLLTVSRFKIDLAEFFFAWIFVEPWPKNNRREMMKLVANYVKLHYLEAINSKFEIFLPTAVYPIASHLMVK